jgi:hypothetical protein
MARPGQSGRTPGALRVLGPLAVVVASSVALLAAELKPKTTAAYERYIRLTEAAMDARLSKRVLIDIDAWPEAKRNDLYARLRKGEVFVERNETKDGGKSISVPDGLIHDWRGVVWLPGVTLARVIALAQDYNHYSQTFTPAIRSSALLSRDGDTFTFQQRFVFKHILTGVVNATSVAVYTTIDGTRAYLRSRSTRIAEVANVGTPQEHELPVGHDSGYLWRANAYWNMEERDGGTWLQCEWITLSRDLPFGLGLIGTPIVRGVARETSMNTLIAVRTALAKPGPGD